MPSKEDLLLEKRRYGLKEEISSFELEQLNIGMPVQKIMGYIEMADIKIDIRHNVLIPRYETEELIYLAFQEIKQNGFKSVLDLCSGSGFIGLAIKNKYKDISVTLSDISDEAIKSQELNSNINNLKVNILQSDLFENIRGKFDIIVSNPPYIGKDEKLNISVLDFEPHNALFAEDNGLFFYKKIIELAPKYLNKNGVLLFEINPLHTEYWNSIKNKFKLLEITKDLSNKNRFVKIIF
ncbi:peptide chain release factor N(5)-glutamine methyltransferase [Mycoplasma sp. CSL7503-lung]|uniref:peptide chain release factor N(5)-glutamine methyltransferase n=1 Tax=Mycoplasma sp. CSL7503-lung TaxID=536372 RepID=UPI0021D1334B|nr:peptide chain release factor N(5)-glutamine methyltransferase [Mycoplasma sp. CSL7503-lung]MCU4706537.1 peptide chain release factor N(5)-glutamine methyltransferase [Mycoplasma sp. CSL7503-lung]